MRLKDKVAIVTGGGLGIGKAIALDFAREGAIVALAAPNMSDLEDVANQIKSEGGKAVAICIDVTEEEQVSRMVSRTLEEFGRIDILVNNSGIAGPTSDLVNLSLADWNQTLAVNLTGTMLCSREVLKVMIPCQSGNVVNISSAAALSGFTMRSPYCASKWGVIGLTLTTAAEVGIHSIRVNCISPGPVEGQRIHDVIRAKAEASGASYEAAYDIIASKMALRRFVTADEISAAAIYFASDESRGITGEVLNVNAGFLKTIF